MHDLITNPNRFTFFALVSNKISVKTCTYSHIIGRETQLASLNDCITKFVQAEEEKRSA